MAKENLSSLDFRTPKQVEREKRKVAVCNLWKQMRQVAGDSVSDSRVIEVVAQNLGVTSVAVRQTLYRTGLLQRKRNVVIISNK